MVVTTAGGCWYHWHLWVVARDAIKILNAEENSHNKGIPSPKCYYFKVKKVCSNTVLNCSENILIFFLTPWECLLCFSIKQKFWFHCCFCCFWKFFFSPDFWYNISTIGIIWNGKFSRISQWNFLGSMWTKCYFLLEMLSLGSRVLMEQFTVVTLKKKNNFSLKKHDLEYFWAH